MGDILNILYSTIIDPDTQSSPAQHILSVIAGWEKQGHSVRLLHPHAAIGQAYVESSPGSKISLILDRFRKDWSFSWALVQELRKGSYDLAYHRFALSSVFPVLRAKLAGVPLVLEINADLDSDLERHWGGNPIISLLIRWMAALQFYLADRIVAVSEGIGEKLRRNPLVKPERVAVVPNGADLDQFYPRDKSQARQELGLDTEMNLVVYAGGFQPYQGVEDIILAAAQLDEEDCSLQICLLGEGPEKARLQEMAASQGISSRVKFVGWCSPEITALYLAASDLCLAPYTRAALMDPTVKDTFGAPMKGSPLKIYTYLAAGRPVIASHFAEAGVFVEDHKAGIAVEPNDPGGLAGRIRYLLDNPRMLMNMGESAQCAAKDKFGWDKTSERISAVCQQVIPSRS